MKKESGCIMNCLSSILAGVFAGCLAAAGGEPAIPSGIYGSNVHLIDRVGEDMENYPALLNSMRSEGCTWGRSDNYWVTNEPAPGKWNFEETDRFFRDARKVGVTILPIFVCSDQHIPVHYRPFFSHLPEFRAYLERFVTRYRDTVKCWQISNEPNSGGGQTRMPACGDYRNYLKLLKLAHETIKKAAPEAAVIHAGLIGIDNELTGFDYLERELKEGMAQYCDVLSIHPYLESNHPEEIYPAGLERLKRLLKRYGAERKPLWVTELGDSIGTPPEWEKFYPAAFEKAGIDPARTVLAVIEDPEWNFFTEGWMLHEGNLGVKFREKRAIRLAGLKNLEPRSVLLLGTSGDFQAEFYPALQNYLRRGGTIVSTWVPPLFFELSRDKSGRQVRKKVERKYLAGLHLNWEAFWTCPGLPREFRTLRSAFPGMTDFGRFRMAGRVLSEANLKPGDALIPLVYGEENGIRYPVAGVYRFNSDFKGRAIVSLMWGYPFKARSAADSARSWPRSVLLLRAGGVEKVFTYKYRIHKNRTAQDFGLHSWNLEKHDGAVALETLFRLFPEGTSLRIVHRHNPWIIRGVRPDGRVVHAVWLRQGSREFRLNRHGMAAETVDYLGRSVKLPGGPVPVSDAPLYLSGPERVTVE